MGEMAGRDAGGLPPMYWGGKAESRSGTGPVIRFMICKAPR